MSNAHITAKEPEGSNFLWIYVSAIRISLLSFISLLCTLFLAKGNYEVTFVLRGHLNICIAAFIDGEIGNVPSVEKYTKGMKIPKSVTAKQFVCSTNEFYDSHDRRTNLCNFAERIKRTRCVQTQTAIKINFT